MRARTTTRTTTAALAALALTLLTGCGGGSDDAAAPAADEQLGSVETMFGTVDVPAPEDGELDVVALGWSDAEMALSLGVVPVAVFDWMEFGAESKGVGPWAVEQFGDVEPTVFDRGQETLNYEQIQGLDPDVILNVRSSNDEAEHDRLSEIAPTVYAPEGTSAFATEWRVQLRSIGAALGRSEQAEEVIADVDGQIDEAAAAHPEFAGTTVASVSKFGDAYGAYLPGDGRFDLLGDLGFVNNPPIEALAPSGFFAAVSVEDVPVFDAETAVVLPIGYTLAETQAHPLLASLPVVQEGRAVFRDPETELGSAWSTASALSIPVVLDQVVPQLADAVAKVG